MLCLVAQSCPTLCNPWTVACQAPLPMGILQARILEWVAMPSSRESSQPRDPTQVSHSLPSEPPKKLKNTGEGSLSFLEGIFLTQEWNWGLLHCRRILTSWDTVMSCITHYKTKYIVADIQLWLIIFRLSLGISVGIIPGRVISLKHSVFVLMM